MATEGIRIGVRASAITDDARLAPRLAREAGFEGLQFDPRFGGVDLTELSASGRREFRRISAASNVELIGLRADAGPNGLASGSDVDRVLARLDRLMETAAALGAPLICVEIGPLPSVAPEEPPPKVTSAMAGLILLPTPAQETVRPAPAEPPPDPETVAQVDAAMRELGRRADRYSVTLAFRSETASFASLERALRAADCPWFGVDFDPAAQLRDPWDPDQIFSRLGRMIRHVRGRDAIAAHGAATRSTAIGRGSVRWPAVLENLLQAEYRGWITLDPLDLPDPRAAATAGLQFLRPNEV